MLVATVIRIGHYDIAAFLGAGAMGQVRCAVNAPTGPNVIEELR
jgi:hypothetical protein